MPGPILGRISVWSKRETRLPKYPSCRLLKDFDEKLGFSTSYKPGATPDRIVPFVPNLCTLDAKFEESKYDVGLTFVSWIKFPLFDGV